VFPPQVFHIIQLWFMDVVSVHRRELGDLPLSPTGYDFLAFLKPSASTHVSAEQRAEDDAVP
jgi:hypothetical protein